MNLLRSDQALAEMEPLPAFFASFVLDTNLVRSIMRWDMAVLRESPSLFDTALEVETLADFEASLPGSGIAASSGQIT